MLTFFPFLEGQLTSLQAYQTLRNCGTDLIFERPERRIELAHYFWDRILELGNYENAEWLLVIVCTLRSCNNLYM